MISDRIENINQSHNIFAAAYLPFPNFLTGFAASTAPMGPQQGVLSIDPAQPVPPSISV